MHTEKDDKIIIKIKRAGNIPIPEYETLDAAGCDIYNTETVTLYPGVPTLVPTGLFVEIPKGYEIQVRPRSGLALKDAITVLNSPGTIDSDYRGEIGVILFWTGTTTEQEKFNTLMLYDESIGKHNSVKIIPAYSKIAQLVVNKVYRAEFIESKLSDTERGAGGFGSTGV